MLAVGSREAKERFGELVSRVGYGRERVVIEKHGRPVAVLVSVEELEYLDRLEEMWDAMRLRAAMETSTGTVGIDEVLAALEGQA